MKNIPGTVEDMRSRATLEMEGYITALGDFVDSRMMSLAEGELAAYSKVGLLSEEDAMRYRLRLNELSKGLHELRNT